jgi:hypothetical protein
MVRKGGIQPVIPVFFAFILLAGCEQIFTFSPIAFLATPVSQMNPEQQINYGKDALASGDDAKMAEAYTALSANTSSGEAQYTAALLGAELSGVPEFISKIILGDTSLSFPSSTDSADFMTFLAANGLQAEYLVQAAGNFQAAQALGETLEATDVILAAFGLVLDAATQTDGTIDFAAIDPGKITEAQDFITTASTAILAALPPTDPTSLILQGFMMYVGGF